MSATQATYISTQVSMKYWRSVRSLSIDMSADYRTSTLGRYVDQHIDRNVSQHIDRHTDQHIMVDISTEYRSICRPKSYSSITEPIEQLFDRLVWIELD